MKNKFPFLEMGTLIEVISAKDQGLHIKLCAGRKGIVIKRFTREDGVESSENVYQVQLDDGLIKALHYLDLKVLEDEQKI